MQHAPNPEFRLLADDPTPTGQHLSLEVMGARHEVDLPLVGGFQASKALAARGLVVATGGDPARAVAALAPDRGTLHVVHDEIPGLLFAGTHEFHADAPTIASVQLGRRLFGRIEQRAGQWWLFDVRLAQ